MKKLLLIGLILAILILAMPQGVLAVPDSAPSATISAKVDDVLECHATGPGGTWSLTRGIINDLPGTTDIQTTVDSTVNWDQTASTTTNGLMIDSNTGENLIEPLYIGVMPSDMSPLSDNVLLRSGSPQAIATYYNDITQQVRTDDFSGAAYQITITFTCAQQIEGS